MLSDVLLRYAKNLLGATLLFEPFGNRHLDDIIVHYPVNFPF